MRFLATQLGRSSPTETSSLTLGYIAGVHRPGQAGICGGKDGAESIVVSGGYVDDEDYGDEIIYTDHGGNDPTTKRQNADQHLTRGNAGLARSQLEGYPVRSSAAPAETRPFHRRQDSAMTACSELWITGMRWAKTATGSGASA